MSGFVSGTDISDELLTLPHAGKRQVGKPCETRGLIFHEKRTLKTPPRAKTRDRVIIDMSPLHARGKGRWQAVFHQGRVNQPAAARGEGEAGEVE